MTWILTSIYNKRFRDLWDTGFIMAILSSGQYKTPATELWCASTNVVVSINHPVIFSLPEVLDGPAPEAILELHRAPDAYLTFHTKCDQFEDVCSIPCHDLRNMFPSLVQELVRDSYFSVNAFFRAGRGRSKRLPHMKSAYRRREGLRYLNACFADLDCYRINKTPGETIGEIIALQNSGAIPPASLIAQSGRGIWLYWILGDRSNMLLPPRAHDSLIELYNRIQSQICDRLKSLGSDDQAKDTSRITRVPGSIHSATNSRVHYWIQKDAAGNGFVYTLDELAKWFNVAVKSRLKLATTASDMDMPDQVKVDQIKTCARKAKQALNSNRLRQFETLWALRKRFQKNTRNHAALLFANFLLINGTPMSTIRERIAKFGASCDPPLEYRRCESAIRQAHTLKKLRNQTIADWLDITPDETKSLETWVPAERFASHNPPKIKKVLARRTHIKQIITETSSVPTIQEMVALLAGRGIVTSRSCVGKDYKELDIQYDSISQGQAGTQEKLLLFPAPVMPDVPE